MNKVIQIKVDGRIKDSEMIIIHDILNYLFEGCNPEIKSREGTDEVLCSE